MTPCGQCEARNNLCALLSTMFRIIVNTAVVRQKTGCAVDQELLHTLVNELFSGELARHAIMESSKAANRFSTATQGQGSELVVDERFLGFLAADDPGPLQSKCGLQFPVAAIANAVHTHVPESHTYASGGASRTEFIICLAAILEYISAEVLELGGNAARDRRTANDDGDGDLNNEASVIAGDVENAIDNDEELQVTRARFNARVPGLGGVAATPSVSGRAGETGGGTAAAVQPAAVRRSRRSGIVT